MRGRVALAAIAAVAGTCSVSAPGWAAPGDSTNTGKDDNRGTILGTAGREGWSGSRGSGPMCTWTRVTGFGVIGVGGSDIDSHAVEGGFVDERADGDYVLYHRSACRDGRPDGFYWVPPVSAAEVRRDAFRRIERSIPLPALNMNPDPAAGGYVNLGLWLAITDPGGRSVTASVGPVWVTVTASLDSITWDMGNRDSVICDDLGTPIIDLDTTEQGACGYTYRNPSAPQYTGDGLAYHASVTSAWSISWVDYIGATGALEPMYRTTPFDYQVREIQTVGVASP